MNEERKKKLFTVLGDLSLGEDFMKAETFEDVKEIFVRKGINVTEEEVDEVMNLIAENTEGEVSENELAQVSGGFALTGALLYGGAALITYGAAYLAGKWAKKKSGVCM